MRALGVFVLVTFYTGFGATFAASFLVDFCWGSFLNDSRAVAIFADTGAAVWRESTRI